MTNQVIPEAAVPMIARNAAFLALASKYPNSDLVYSVEFSQALKEALEAAAPHMLAGAFEGGFQKGVEFQEWAGHLDDHKPDFTNPYRPTP